MTKSVFASPRTFAVLIAAVWLSTFDGPRAQRQQHLATATRDVVPKLTGPDPLLENQWHLKARTLEVAGANVRAEWPSTEGAGVVIGIVDDGLQWTHPDLQPNYLASASHDFNFNDADPTPFSSDSHGTSVAGVAAARDNNAIGVAGAAPQATLAGLRLTAAGTTDAQTAEAIGYLPDVIHVSSNSWGIADTGDAVAGPGPLTYLAEQTAVTVGRQGRGRVFVWAAGNGGQNRDDCNFDGFANSRFVIAVGALADSGNQAIYSEPCSAMLVTAPSSGGPRGITTTDLVGSQGADPSDYTSTFGGTSSATPLVSGAVALMLARNPNLGWRDVQHILRRTSVRVQPADAGWTAGPFPHNEKFGFGQLDAQAAADMAATWVNVPGEAALTPPSRTPNLIVPDNNSTGVSDTIDISSAESGFVIEHIEVDFSAIHPYRGDLQVTLTSPSGVVSKLAPARTPHDPGDDFNNWRLMSVRHWGESPVGTWRLRVADLGALDTGTWTGWTLRIYGYRAVAAPGSFGKNAPANGAVGQATSPSLSWTPSAGAVSYEYCFDTTNDNACSSWIGVGAALGVALNGLGASTTYYWQVRATNGGGTTYADTGAFWNFTPGPVLGTVVATPTSLRFGATKSGASGGLTHVTPAQRVTVTFLGAPAAWTATSNQTWLQVTNGQQAGAGQFTATVVNPGNVIGGSTLLSATVTLTAPGSPNSPLLIPITLAVDQTDQSTEAFGLIDTPAQNTIGLQGAIGVTGWALDDIGVDTVRVYRSCLASDSPSACQLIQGASVVYVGDGVFLAGARPDVAGVFSHLPQSHRAGWGMQILSNMLPHGPTGQPFGGQGPLALYAVATDLEGHATVLGRTLVDHFPTQITLDNDHIAKPFGTLDTPGPGATVSGLVANFGWAITPDTDTIAGNGDVLISPSTPQMFVFIDGVATAVVTYNQCRGNVGNPPASVTFCNDDVANIFGNAAPQASLSPRTANPTRFRNLDAGRGAIGSYVIDTTLLSNGLHSLAWSVADSLGRTEGIGSRLFNVLNATSVSANVPDVRLRLASAPVIVPSFGWSRVVPTIASAVLSSACSAATDCPEESTTEPLSDGPSAHVDALPAPTDVEQGGEPSVGVTYRVGFDLRAPFLELESVPGGVPVIQIPELGRIEIDLGGAVDLGYVQADAVEPLPAGSSLDAARGRFSWTPPPGYLGTYRLVFTRGTERIIVDVTIGTRVSVKAFRSPSQRSQLRKGKLS